MPRPRVRTKIKSTMDQTLVTGMEIRRLSNGEVTTVSFASQQEFRGFIDCGVVVLADELEIEHKPILIIE